MTKLFISIVSFLLYAHLILSSPVPDPEAIVEEVHKYKLNLISSIFFLHILLVTQLLM